MPPDLALLPPLIGSNYPCLELIFMVPKVFEPLKFDCICIFSIHHLFELSWVNDLLFQHSPYPKMRDISILAEGIDKLLIGLNPHKTTGPDKLMLVSWLFLGLTAF